jgi:hypothetical protein
MIELFRYIEHSYIGSRTTDAVDTETHSQFQRDLAALKKKSDAEPAMRNHALLFIERHFDNSAEGDFTLGEQLGRFHHELLTLATPSAESIDALAVKVFGKSAEDVVASGDFSHDEEVLNDSLVAVKITTSFDQVNAASLVASRQAASFLRDLAAGDIATFDQATVRTHLLRPIRIPQALFLPKASPPPAAPPANERDDKSKNMQLLMREMDDLKAAYDGLMAVHPQELVIIREKQQAPAVRKAPSSAPAREQAEGVAIRPPIPSILALSGTALRKMSEGAQKAIRNTGLDLENTSLPRLLEKVKQRCGEVSKELQPHLLPPPAKVYQLGHHAFAVRQTFSETTPGKAPDQ